MAIDIRPKTDEVEWAFSAAGTLCTRIRSGLGDDALDELRVLRSFYRRRYEAYEAAMFVSRIPS